MFGSSLPPIVCRRAHVLSTLFVLACIYWCPTHIVLCLRFVYHRLVYPMLPISLDCPFLEDKDIYTLDCLFIEDKDIYTLDCLFKIFFSVYLL
jgi:hypothetical protein